MYREIHKELIAWKNSPSRDPLIIRGARQVGKSYSVAKLAEEEFEHFALVNFERRPELEDHFTVTLDPAKIVASLSADLSCPIVAGKTLLFLDEIQLCPKAIMALRYFKEEMPELHVVAAGSLLEFSISEEEFSFPVGRVQFMFLRPLSFQEFLRALGKDMMVEYLQEEVTLIKPPSPAIHSELLKLIQQYAVIGGMPRIVEVFLQTGSYLEVLRRQEALLRLYESDFSKYARKTDYNALRTLFNKAADFVGRHVKYTKIDSTVTHPHRTFKKALEQLTNAGLLRQIYATSANGLPLRAGINAKKFKLLMLDIGLYQRSMGVSHPEQLLTKQLHDIHSGALAEQLVGQELIANVDSYIQARLYFWTKEDRSDGAEIDYLQNINGQIVPFEVKAGKTGRLKSLRRFMEQKKAPLGVRISTLPLQMENDILTLPFYLIPELPRLLNEN